jgi:hypothetical protein
VCACSVFIGSSVGYVATLIEPAPVVRSTVWGGDEGAKMV